MEAASVFLQAEEDDFDAEIRRIKSTQAILGESNEARAGARSVSGSVALANVPAMHGGYSGTTDSTREDTSIDPIGRVYAHPRVSSPVSGVPAGKASRWGKSGAPASTGGDLETGGSVANPVQPTRRKMSFTRKAGRKIVRSLSFGAEIKREWGSAAS